MESCMQLTLACFHPATFHPLWLIYLIFYVKRSSCTSTYIRLAVLCAFTHDENDPAIYIEYHNKESPSDESLSRLWLFKYWFGSIFFKSSLCMHFILSHPFHHCFWSGNQQRLMLSDWMLKRANSTTINSFYIVSCESFNNGALCRNFNVTALREERTSKVHKD